MSRQLPTRVSLEYLRKEAKQLLSQLQDRSPGSRLSDAQHALAREYGFASWPKLKAHVEARAGAADAHPFSGRWVANAAKSRSHPDRPFQAAIVEFEVDRDRVRITDRVVDGTGRQDHANDIRVDGTEAQYGNGYTLTATWHGARVLETVAHHDGHVVGRGRYEVSDDGTTMTVTSDEALIVFDRVTTPG